MSDAPPFKRDELVDTAGIVGARWWHEGLTHANPVGRRAALQGLLAAGGLLAVGVFVSKSSACAPDAESGTRGALEMQKQFGWDFGARGDPMTFDGVATQPFDPAGLTTLEKDLAPSRAALRPYFIPTLLQSVSAVPQAALPGDAPFVPLGSVLRPGLTPAMDLAYRRGKALASLFEATPSDAAIAVDLRGPESVAFAAGAASVFDPVFAVDNWPHPRGVVPAHTTLAAAAYYQPLFAKAATARRPNAAPMFVFDRARLAPYSDAGAQFDNRHLARLPPAAKLVELGIRRLLYVAPTVADVPELDDLNDEFVFDVRMGLVIKIVGADAFGPELADRSTTPTWAALAAISPPPPSPDGGLVSYYGWTRATNDAFWVDYPWLAAKPPNAPPSNVPPDGKDYTPHARVSAFSSGNPSGAASRTTPTEFGLVTVAVASATGAILGAMFSRNGSWNRSGGSWGGG